MKYRIAVGCLAGVLCAVVLLVFGVPEKSVWVPLIFLACVVVAGVLVGMVSAMRSGDK